MSDKISNSIKGLALFSLVLALSAAALVSPGSAAAATCTPVGMGPQACIAVSVNVYDRLSGRPINDAKVELVDSNGNVTYAYDLRQIGGRYTANVTPDSYRVVVTAPTYFSYSTDIQVETKPPTVNAPLMPSTLDSPKGSSS